MAWRRSGVRIETGRVASTELLPGMAALIRSADAIHPFIATKRYNFDFATRGAATPCKPEPGSGQFPLQLRPFKESIGLTTTEQCHERCRQRFLIARLQGARPHPGRPRPQAHPDGRAGNAGADA